MSKEILFSVTAADCDWKFTKGSGPGGQKKNKTSSAVYCIHRASGAQGYSEATRSQHLNKREAFVKMANSDVFKKWHKLETLRRLGTLYEIEAKVDYELCHNTKIEYKKD